MFCNESSVSIEITVSGVLNFHDFAVWCFVLVFAMLDEHTIWMLFVNVLNEARFLSIDVVSSFVSIRIAQAMRKKTVNLVQKGGVRRSESKSVMLTMLCSYHLDLVLCCRPKLGSM